MNKIAFYHGHLKVCFHLEYVCVMYLHCMYTAADITTNLISLFLCVCNGYVQNTFHSIPSCLSLTAAYNDNKRRKNLRTLQDIPNYDALIGQYTCQSCLSIFEEDPASHQNISEEISSTSQGTF